jgi:hypothetical protein
MEEKTTQTYMKLQMDELKTVHGMENAERKSDAKDQSGKPEDEEIAKLYEDCAEYEEELLRFDRELELIKSNEIAALAEAMAELGGETKAQAEEKLKAVVEHGWSARVENGSASPASLERLRSAGFCDLVSVLGEALPDESVDVESEIKSLLIERWELYINIKKEHIKEEVSYIKALGLKPHYAQKIYKRYHGID